MKGQTITLTLGEVAENHAGNQQIGTKSKTGFTKDDLLEFKDHFEAAGFDTEWVDLFKHLPEKYHGLKGVAWRGGCRTGSDTGFVLIVRNGVEYGCEANQLFEEQRALTYDKKALMRGRVVNKRARYNLCFDHDPQDADYEKGMGTIISYKDVPMLAKLHSSYSGLVEDKGYPELKVESNYYYDTAKCGIGYHGDTERSIVIGARLGTAIPLTYRWYYQKESVTDPIPVTLNHGDVYFMSEKATGNDWKKWSMVTLRHAAGCSEYTKLREK